jgi:GNAT superfamily N-acetyltransferase
MPDLVIRQADGADRSLLIHVLGQEAFFKARLRMQRRRHGILLVAWQGSVPVGTVYLWLAPAEEKELRRELPDVPILNRLSVTETQRRRGIGTRLIEEAERVLRERGHKRVALGVGPGNRLARRLYERLGYRDWGHGEITGRVEADLGSGSVGRRRETFTILVKDL